MDSEPELTRSDSDHSADIGSNDSSLEHASETKSPEFFVMPSERTVRKSLEAICSGTVFNKRRKWILFFQSLVLFIIAACVMGFGFDNLDDLVILVVVVIIHELGHLFGMKLFQYRNVQLFFIPFLGAGVAGRKQSVNIWKIATVILLGPVPGILIGCGLWWFYLETQEWFWGKCALWFILLNAFNLLPLYPLDGGQLLQLLFFTKNPYLEAGFQFITGIMLAIAGFYSQKTYLLGFFGLFVALRARNALRLAKTAKQLKENFHVDSSEVPDRIPDDDIPPILSQVRAAFPEIRFPGQMATTMLNIWERIHLTPPRLATSFSLFTIYLLTFFPIGYVPFAITTGSEDRIAHTYEEMPTSYPVYQQVRFNNIYSETELNLQGYYNGRFYYQHAQYKVKGGFKDGIPIGRWDMRFPGDKPARARFDESGNLISIETRDENQNLLPMTEEIRSQVENALANLIPQIPMRVKDEMLDHFVIGP